MAARTNLGRGALLLLFTFQALLLGACAIFEQRQPIEVILAGVEPLPSEGLELRLRLKLRIQNPNDQPLDYDGVSVQLDLQGKRFATGVSNAAGRVPRFGEALVEVPVSISVLRLAHQALGVMASEYRGKLAYELSGRLAGPAFGSASFASSGALTLPAELFEARR